MSHRFSSRLRCTVPAIALVLGSVHGVTAQGTRGAADLITAADVLHHLSVIADDSMRGRDTPSRGLDLTAAYVAAQFRAAGLEPAGDSGSFVQHFPYAIRRLDTTARMIRLSDDDTFAPVFGTDLFVVPSDEHVIEGSAYYAGVVDTSFAMPAGVRAPIVIGTIADTMGPAWGERFNALLIAAATSGAKAMIIALDPRITAASVGELAQEASEQLAPITVFGVRMDALAPLLRAGGVDAASPASLAKPMMMNGVKLRLATATTVSEARVPNVAGILRGSDPSLREEYVVFSAHMDHVGVGAPDASGDSIYNGADDDGSGTTAIIELARAFTSQATRPARSIIFLTVSGEEKGLLGSDYFTTHPTVPMAKIIADINIDMIGRNAPDSVTAVGLEYTTLGRVAINTAKDHPELGVHVAADHQPEEHLFERSDHFNFARRNVPAIFFTTGLHGDYHKPSDEVSRIDTDKLARVARLVFYIGYAVADAPGRPSFTGAGLDVIRRARGN
jgi:hypothetical protein